jgi:hypothetical protein
MPQIFGRETKLEYGILGDVCLNVLTQVPPEDNDRAVAWNLMHERRVDDQWGDFWFRQNGQPGSPQTLRDSLNGYQNRLRTYPIDAYADLESKAGNFVNPGSTEAPERSEQLVNVFDLWSPGSRIIWNYGFTRSLGILARTGKFDKDAKSMPDSFLSILETNTIDAQTPLMETFFDAMKQYLEEVETRRRTHDVMATLNPSWVTLWKKWLVRVGDSANDWCDSVGLAKDPARWVAVVTYPVHQAKRLICPTQLEAGWYGRHFPTPPLCCTGKGGRVVEGRPSLYSAPNHTLLPEFIHAPVPLSLSNWLASGFPVRSTSRPVGSPAVLRPDREGHWHGLDREFGDIKAWMPRANP